MRLYVQEENDLIKFNLPAKVEGSLLFTYKTSDSDIENSINIDSNEGAWFLKSNGNINIIMNDSILSETKLEDYMCIPITKIGRNDYTCIFCLPSIEETHISYRVQENQEITIGSDRNNNIVYSQNMMYHKHATIRFQNKAWYISPEIIGQGKDKLYIYINNKRVLKPTKLKVGDTIFMNGLRIIWMRNFIKIPMNDELFKVNGLSIINENEEVDNTKYTPVSEADANTELYKEDEYFSHMPRIRSVIEKKIVKVDGPPGKQISDTEMPFLLSIGTSFTMLGMTSMNAYNIGYGLYSGTSDLHSLLPSIVMCVTMLVGSLIIPIIVRVWQKKMAKKREAKRQKKYGEYLNKKEKEIEIILKKQAQILVENNSDLKTCQEILKTKNRTLWSREINDDDFVNIRLGIGNRPAFIEIDAPEDKFTLDDDNLYQKVVAIRKKYNMLQNVPITANLKEEIVTGFILTSFFTDAFINSIILQLITYHSPLDLKIVVITDKTKEDRWEYVKYLPHNWNNEKTIRFFASNLDDVKVLTQYLEEEYTNRVSKRKEKESENRDTKIETTENYALYDSYYLIITDNFKLVKNHKFTKDLLDNQFNYGFSMAIIDKSMKNLPKECQKFIYIANNESGVFSGELKEEDTIKFEAEYDEHLDMETTCHFLSNIPVQGEEAEQQLPVVLPFLEMYNVGKIEQLNIRNRWEQSSPTQSLQAPVGVHTNGELFELDLHESFDGPHGLIAGSTGSGKSEFIITYILSMAINYDPKEVQFVLIDYKGGGLAGAFENREAGISIPHLAGTITNLDTAEMNRTLVSIESELRRRQQKFNQVREATGESTMDIYKYQKLYREGTIKEPISHLFIICDEFAELKSQQPDFMAQLISTARIGRSLGVHLVLATQKPSGVVNDQIWSNSRFKVCLKVQSRADSMEMLKRPEAASIKETGRFYLQVGYDEYFDIGQSAWSGAKYKPVERIVKKIDDTIMFVNNSGNIIKRISDTVKQEEKKEELGDQLTNIVKYLAKIAKDIEFKPIKLWLPALKKKIIVKDLINKYNYKKPENTITAIIGEYDAPRTQHQGVLALDFKSKGNLLIYGNAGSGKENLISSIIYDLCSSYSPQDINIYVGDFGAETLKNFSKMPQVGDVFVTDDKEKLINFLQMINKEFERRKKEYSDYGGNFIEYQKFTNKKEPLLLYVLNNFEVFQETYPKYMDAFNAILRDGTKYGINFIISTASTTSVRSRVSQYFLNKICLKLSNDYEYRDILGCPKGMVPADNYGRGIVSLDGESQYEFQTADFSDNDNKTRMIFTTAKELIKRYPTQAPKIQVLPDVVYVEDVEFELKGLGCMPIGIEKNSLEVYVFNFLENKINIIAAKSLKNHIYFIYALIRQMLMLKNVKIHIIDALSIYRGKYENIELYQNNMEDAFITTYKNVQKDKEQKEKHVYFILGMSEFKKSVTSKYKNYFEVLFSQASKCKNNIFLLFDDSDEYKKIQVESWYRDNINNTYGIWLGEDIGVQTALGVMSLTIEDKQNVFPCIGYPIYKGKHMTIKYVVDGVDKNEK